MLWCATTSQVCHRTESLLTYPKIQLSLESKLVLYFSWQAAFQSHHTSVSFYVYWIPQLCDGNPFLCSLPRTCTVLPGAPQFDARTASYGSHEMACLRKYFLIRFFSSCWRNICVLTSHFSSKAVGGQAVSVMVVGRKGGEFHSSCTGPFSVEQLLNGHRPLLEILHICRMMISKIVVRSLSYILLSVKPMGSIFCPFSNKPLILDSL